MRTQGRTGRLVGLLLASLVLGATACSSGEEAAPAPAAPTDGESAPVSRGTTPDGFDCIDVPNTDGSFEAVKDAGVLRIGHVDGLLPYSSSDDGTPGFERLMANYIAEQMCLEPEPVYVSWDGLIPGLTGDRYDVIFNGLFITDARREQVDFSFPYYASGETILVQKGNPLGIATREDLRDKAVGVLIGSVTVTLLEEEGFTDLRTYNDQNQIILELSNGRLDAGYLEAPSSAWAVKQDAGLNVEIVDSYVPDERFNAGAAVRQEDTDLLIALNYAVARLVATGKVDEILGEYNVPYFPSR